MGFRCQGEAVVDDKAIEGVACCGVELKAPGAGDSRNRKARMRLGQPQSHWGGDFRMSGVIRGLFRQCGINS